MCVQCHWIMSLSLTWLCLGKSCDDQSECCWRGPGGLSEREAAETERTAGGHSPQAPPGDPPPTSLPSIPWAETVFTAHQWCALSLGGRILPAEWHPQPSYPFRLLTKEKHHSAHASMAHSHLAVQPFQVWRNRCENEMPGAWDAGFCTQMTFRPSLVSCEPVSRSKLILMSLIREVRTRQK